MNIARKIQAKEIVVGETNEKCTEIGYVIEGSGKLVIEGEEILFQEGDQLLLKPGQRYYWEAKATMFMPCAPAWYPEQHKEVE
jgi:mannose-6-phosphate isomerase-like protein (cupin superfamily)